MIVTKRLGWGIGRNVMQTALIGKQLDYQSVFQNSTRQGHCLVLRAPIEDMYQKDVDTFGCKRMSEA